MSAARRKYMVDGLLLDEEQVRAIFNDGLVDWERLPSREKVALEMASSVIAPQGRLLDVGCYAGMFVAAVKSLYPQVDAWGIDYYEDNIAIARLLYPAMADRYQRMSAYALGFEDETFDCVTFKEVIEHIDRPVDALREINRVLRPGGHLVLSTPNANAQAWQLFFSGLHRLALRIVGRKSTPGRVIYFQDVEWNRHIYSWTPSTLNTLLLSNGFEYAEHRFYCNSPLQRLFPDMGDGMAFLVRKSGPAPAKLV
jgi:2-polyprenyl-3-methyl-5-hydroxy-6-metoxy-1,4-benzoquinol methylase